jgi:3-isopropylmalate/(R)-2-methylmalate dehydratase large subunit
MVRRANSETEMPGKTLYDKIWDAHVVHTDPASGESLLYIDLHLIHEVTTPQAFDGLKVAGRRVRRPELTLAVADHNTKVTRRWIGCASQVGRARATRER